MSKTKVILDTDIGTDPDDTLCLTYLLKQADCDLLGVTTVGRDVTTRAQFAEVFTRHFGAGEVPIRAGAEHPYILTEYWYHHQLSQMNLLDYASVHTEYAPGRAVGLLRDLIRSHPGEVTIVAVGPLTNIGLLAASDPETASMVNGVVAMAGIFSYDPQQPATECNTMLDPASTSVVLRFPWPDFRFVSADVTRGKHIMYEDLVAQLDTEHFAPLLSFHERLNRHGEPQDRIGVHDPMTAASVFEPELVEFTRGRIDLLIGTHDLSDGRSLQPGRVTGWTSFTNDPDGPHQIATQRDGTRVRKKLHEHLFSVLKS